MGQRGEQCSALKDLNSLLRNFNLVLNTVGTSNGSDQIRKVCGADGLRNLVGLSADLETFKNVVSEIQARNNQERLWSLLRIIQLIHGQIRDQNSCPSSQAAIVFPSHSAFLPSASSFFREFYSFWNVRQDARMFFQVISFSARTTYLSW